MSIGGIMLHFDCRAETACRKIVIAARKGSHAVTEFGNGGPTARNSLRRSTRCHAVRTSTRPQQICHSLQPAHPVIPDSRYEAQPTAIARLVISVRAGTSVCAPIPPVRHVFKHRVFLLPAAMRAP